MNIPTTLICDICGEDVKLPNGHCLTSAQVVSSPTQWKFYYKRHKTKIALQGINTYEAFCEAQSFLQTIFLIASNPEPWMVCEDCINMFDVDKVATHNYVVKWYESDGKYILPCGAADKSFIDMGDGRSW